MSKQTIIIYIEEEQLVAQKVNNYSLYLAKKVNSSFTVIWLSKPPFATPNQPTYQYKNIFNITNDSYMVNFTNTPLQEGDVNFTSGGKNLPINTGQITTLDQYGVFSPAKNAGTPGDVSINNELLAHPSNILLDSTGLSLWVNRSGGMNIGIATMTPQNEFQLWFGPAQAAGSLIPSSLSNPYNMSVNDGETKTVTYTNQGTWVSGEPATSLTAEEVAELHIRVNKAVLRARLLRR
ncbi:hypothetical protein BK636_06735 [Pseudomonas chlororaphis]|uniref:hypothetical protein n=1 Tax=Pseudomonas chlororaphis TaxID=587753 RepID=UPI000F491EA6|nr:hypothetical protein [Pseudomonas chlororaphis]ROL84663.1 hypothetical protein BK636_06735 [Pseudomonas chlororaphis]ROL92693.1 hypothetical protein BK637_01590 [Pseudomonas chlororaphis]